MTRLFWITFGLLALGGVGWELSDSIASSTFPALILKETDSLTFPQGGSQKKKNQNQSLTETSRPVALSQLEKDCTTTARKLSQSMTAECRILIRAPYVIAGDFSSQELKRYHKEIILPVEKVLFSSYFELRPTSPITILLFSNDSRYQHYAHKLDNRGATNYYGYYSREERRVMLNVSAGTGSLVHGLTHAYSQTDFPTMPEWFDKGFAALHEESDFNKNDTRLIGFTNWRLKQLQTGIRQKKLQTLPEMMTAKKLRSNVQEIDDAHARYFCLFLQQKKLLIPFYQQFRVHQIEDPHGIKTLLKVADIESVEEIDAEFLEWVCRVPLL